MEKFYVNTPIYYVNDKPHIGHAYTNIAADTAARYQRSLGREVIFVTGTDENAQKTVDAAAKNNEEIHAYLERLAGIWRETWRQLDLTNTDFIRTTEERHTATVAEVWKRIEAAGDIYKGTYEGLYCTGCEEFKKESELVNGLCPLHNKAPERVKEENYFFRLSKYQQPLLDLYAQHPDFVQPTQRYNEVKSFVAAGLEDISISRSTQKWGIPVPGDPASVIYVWFEALMNYISAVGLEGWEQHPTDLQVVGKDITRFHAVIWPAMLISAKLPLLKRVIANGFFTINGVKISKSLGNAIDPLKIPRSETTGFDALRYFLLREIPFGGDGDFSFDKYIERHNGDLANGLGNFTSRVQTLVVKHGAFPATAEIDPEVAEHIKAARDGVKTAMEAYRFHEAIAAIWDLIGFSDKYLNIHKPWETNDDRALFSMVAVVDNLGSLLVPFLPETAKLIQASVKNDGKTLSVERGPNLFPRLTRSDFEAAGLVVSPEASVR